MEAFLNVLEYIGYIIVAILCLMFMIVVHESGHYAAGKLLGFKIEEFSIGFGPHIFKRKNKKTGEVFAIRWVPLGGYCAFYGEEYTDDKKKDNKEVEEAPSDVFDELNEADADNLDANANNDANNTAVADTIDTEKKPLSFNEQKPWKRIIVFIAGALFNYLSAIILISIYFMAFGDYSPIVTKVYDDIGVGIEQNFEVGDEILRVNGKSLYTLNDMYDLNKKLKKAGDTAVITLKRDGKIIDVTVNKGTFTPTDDKGTALRDEAGNVIVQSGFGIGIGQYGRVKFGFFESIGRAFVFSFKLVALLFTTIGQLFTGALAIKGNIGGPITTIGTIAMVSRVGFDAVLYAICAMSSTLAVMNLLPLPALDGSKVVFTLIEWVRGKPITRKVENTIHAVGLFLLFGLTILFDILNFI